MAAHSNMMLAMFRKMQASDFGGTITWSAKPYAAVLGSFEIQQTLTPDGGGFTPMLMATVTVAREDLPTTWAGFKRGETVITTPSDTNRATRTCQVHQMRDCGALIELLVHDVNQGA